MSKTIHSASPWILAAGSLLLLAGTATGQRLQPFAPMALGDYQWFAPVELHQYDGDFVPSKTGFFFTYDRASVTISRPDIGAPAPPPPPSPPVFGTTLPAPDVRFIGAAVDINQESGTDPTWGNRFEFGYMRENDGWSAVVWKLNNPAKKIIVDTVLRDPLLGIGQPTEFPGPGMIEVGLLPTATNDIEIWSVELNKVWRYPPNHRGWVFEPFAGPRFVNARDRFGTEQFVQALVPGGIPAGIYTESEAIETVDIRTNNKMVGGQIGLRVHTRRGRWILASEIRGFALGNYQDLRTKTTNRGETREVLFDGVNRTDGPYENFFFETETTGHTARFVGGGELKVDVTYELTKKIAIRAGGEVAHFEGGVGRGVGDPKQDLTMAGVLFGFTVNR